MTDTTGAGPTGATADAPLSHREWLATLPVTVPPGVSLEGLLLTLPVPECLKGEVTVHVGGVFWPYTSMDEVWRVCTVVATDRFYGDPALGDKMPIGLVVKVLEQELRVSTPVLFIPDTTTESE